MNKIRQNIRADLNTKLFAVAGRPIMHSLSPLIWNYAFEKLKINASYFKITGSSAKQIVGMIKEIGLAGCNITSPFKEEIIQYLDEVKADAKKISAVNCIKNDNGKLTGYNTDVEGFNLALLAANFDPKGKKIIVLGAGGAAKAVMFSLLKHGAKDVLILNRSIDKAEKLAKQLDVRTLNINKEQAFKKALKDEIKNTDLIVSCLPSLEAELIDKDLLHNSITVFDANYSGMSKLKKNALEKGCKLIEGEDWLVRQAAIFFKDIFNEDPLEYMKEFLEGSTISKKNFTPLSDLSEASKISIIGFMGSGKTRMAKVLAEKLGYSFLDLDELIEKKEGLSVKEIFANKGENYFRELETKILNSTLKASPLTDKPMVLACGGGVVTSQENITLLRSNSLVVWRWASLDTIKERLARPKHADKRPLSKDIDKLWELRKALYAKSCDLCVLNIDELL
jgi:shikimate dehydrogenase